MMNHPPFAQECLKDLCKEWAWSRPIGFHCKNIH